MPYPHTPQGILEGMPAVIILKPRSNFLEFTVTLNPIPETLNHPGFRGIP